MKVFVLLLSVVIAARATTVLTRHGSNLLPSSTLRWRHVVIANLKHAIQVDPNEWNSREPVEVRYVCRSFHHGQWIPGHMEKGICFIPWKGMEHGYEQYDVLVGVQGSARMKWAKWTENEELPRLAVSTSSYYITRHWDDVTQRFVIGELSERNVAAHAFLRGKINNMLHTGYILTEIEPIKYELQELEAPRSSWVNLSTTPIQLASTLLVNPHDSDQEAVTTVAYRFTEVLEMERLRGMKPGLMADFTMVNNKLEAADDNARDTHLQDVLDGRNFIIGMELFRDRGEETVVSALVPANSKVNVTLQANYQRYRIPYKAIVKATYKDGHTLSWRDKGNIEFQRLEGLQQGMADSEPVTEEDLAQDHSHVYLSEKKLNAEITTKLTTAAQTTTRPEIIPTEIVPKTTTTRPQTIHKTTTSIKKNIPVTPQQNEQKQNQTVVAEGPNDETAATSIAESVTEEAVKEEDNLEGRNYEDEPVVVVAGKLPKRFLPMMSLEKFLKEGLKA